MMRGLRLGLGGRGGGGSSGGGATLPEGFVHRYDFSNSANYTLDSGVSVATDLGSKGSNLTAASGKRPTISTINGIDAAHFDGTNDILKNTQGSANLGDNFTFAVVFQLDVVPAVPTAIFGFSNFGTNSGKTQFYLSNTSNTFRLFIEDTSGSGLTINSGAVAQDTAAHVLLGTLYSDNTADFWVDGVQIANGADTSAASGQVSWSNDHIYIGGMSFFSTSESWFLDGKVGEAVTYSSPLSDGDAGRVNEYLMEKWGIT